MQEFDYEKKMWGVNEVDLNPKFLGATRLQYALAALARVPQGKVLEIGCGGGAFTRAIKRHRPELEVIGSDLSRSVLEVARKMGGEVSYRKADVYKLPFARESFDAVVSFDVWEHLERPVDAFKEAHRVLKPGGVLHFFVPAEGNPTSLYQLIPKPLYRIKQRHCGHVQAYTKDKLTRLLDKTGFEVKTIKNSSYYIYQIVDVLYFFYLGLRGRNTSLSVEGYLNFAKGSLSDKLLSLSKSIFGWVTFMEDRLFQKFPGGGLHVTAIKK